MTTTTPAGASAEYRAKREELLAAEIALKDQREAVAALRRRLPPGPAVEDYRFQEGPAELARNDPAEVFETRLSELFAPGLDNLIVVHFMFAPGDEAACPMCSMWADGYDAVVAHVTQKANFVLVAKAEIGELRAWAAERRWRRIRLLSSHDTSFNQNFGMELEDGSQLPGVSVFRRQEDGAVGHVYTGGALLAPEHYRGVDLFSPVWHLFDLLPEGRGDWWPRNRYD